MDFASVLPGGSIVPRSSPSVCPGYTAAWHRGRVEQPSSGFFGYSNGQSDALMEQITWTKRLSADPELGRCDKAS
jgi:hypothetical protein